MVLAQEPIIRTRLPSPQASTGPASRSGRPHNGWGLEEAGNAEAGPGSRPGAAGHHEPTSGQQDLYEHPQAEVPDAPIIAQLASPAPLRTHPAEPLTANALYDAQTPDKSATPRTKEANHSRSMVNLYNDEIEDICK